MCALKSLLWRFPAIKIKGYPKVLFNWICFYSVQVAKYLWWRTLRDICMYFQQMLWNVCLPVSVLSCLHMLLHFPAGLWTAPRSNDFIIHTRGWGGWRRYRWSLVFLISKAAVRDWPIIPVRSPRQWHLSSYPAESSISPPPLTVQTL